VVVLTPVMETVLSIGVQGAGTTAFYRERFFDTHLRISLDMLRSRRGASNCLSRHASRQACGLWWIIHATIAP
jgi:hypothetical protein